MKQKQLFPDVALLKINSTLGKHGSYQWILGEKHNIKIHFSYLHVVLV